MISDHSISWLFEQQASATTSTMPKTVTGIDSPEVQQLKKRMISQLAPAIKDVIKELDRAVSNEELDHDNRNQAFSEIIGSVAEFLA